MERLDMSINKLHQEALNKYAQSYMDVQKKEEIQKRKERREEILIEIAYITVAIVLCFSVALLY